MQKGILKDSVDVFVSEQKEYFEQWYLDDPIIISNAHFTKLARLQKIMYKMIRYFVLNYNELSDFMPVDPKVKEVLDVCKKTEYRVGTYRTDFVYDTDLNVKLIEITSRYPLNAIFLSAITNHLSNSFKESHFPEYNFIHSYDPILDHLETYFVGVEKLYVLHGSDRRNESKIYKRIIERMGIKVSDIYYKDVEKIYGQVSNSLLISELSFEEILSIPIDTIEWLSNSNIINDFRTVFLTHDKRFFSVLCDVNFQCLVLTESEKLFMSEFLIPTYTYLNGDSNWLDAIEQKNKWILKHRSKGKSQDLYCGSLTDEKIWRDILQGNEKHEYILQEWIEQKTYQGRINGNAVNDYICGTLLFFDDNFFGTGLFRTSSYPITNVKDDRKAFSLTLDDDENIRKFKNNLLVI